MPITVHPNDGRYSIKIGNRKEKPYAFSSTNNGDAEARDLSLRHSGQLVVLKKLNVGARDEVVAKWKDGKRV